MKSEAIDWRAVGVGTLAEAVALFTFLTVDLGLGVTLTLAVFATAPVLAGVGVGLTTRGYNAETLEGTFAAGAGIVLAILARGVFQAVTAQGLPLAYKLDVLFLVVVIGSGAFVLVAPVAYLLGGIVAETVSKRRRDEESDPLVVDWASTGED